jgi:hypothetical protein
MTPTPLSTRNLLLTAMLLFGLASCATEAEDLPTYPVRLRLGGALPEGDRVGDYTVTFTEGWIVLGDWWIYGMDREAAGYVTGLKHAGHIHGEAEFETQVTGTFAVDLLGEPALVAINDLTEGHYFDGSIRLRPCTDLYAPIVPDDQTPVSSHDDLWGHSLILAGTATRDASASYDFRITVDAEAMIAGLVYGSTVWEEGTNVITSRLDLGALLVDVDFAALADADGQVLIDADGPPDTYNLIKARLQDPLLYPHSEAEAIPQ